MHVCLHVHMYVCTYTCMYIYVFVCLFCLFVCLSVCLSVCRSVCLYVCMYEFWMCLRVQVACICICICIWYPAPPLLMDLPFCFSGAYTTFPLSVVVKAHGQRDTWGGRAVRRQTCRNLASHHLSPCDKCTYTWLSPRCIHPCFQWFWLEKTKTEIRKQGVAYIVYVGV